MHFSVIIATLGRPDILARTIESIGRCHPPPFELIVIDGDEARTSERATQGEYAFPIRYYTADRGLPKQRNAGIDRANGDVVTFVDDDVEVPLDTFAVLERVFGDDGVLGATARILEPKSQRIGKKHSPVRRLLPGGGEEGRFTRFGYPRRLIDLETERDIDFMHGSFMAVRTKTAREVRFDERLPGYALAEDEDFSYRVSRRGRIRFVSELHVLHAKEGHGSRDARAFGRTLVVNRSYLFRKNFPSSPLARLQFIQLIALFMAHRLVNREWSELRGLFEGSLAARKRPLEKDGAPRSASGEPRVAFVSSHARLGGSEAYLLTLIDLLDRDAVGPVVSLEDGPVVTELRLRGYKVHVIPTSGHPAAIARSGLRLRRYLKGAQVDLVHANGIKAALACAVVRRALPVVWVKHDFSFDGRLTSLVARSCAQVVGVSEAVLQALPEGQRKRAKVVYTGIEMPSVDRPAARQALRAELEADSSDFLIGLVGRMHPVKGHPDFIRAARSLLDERPNARFVFVGGADDSHPEHESAVRQLAGPLEDRAHFLGHRNDVAQVMAGLDVGVMTSNRGGGSNVEALPLTALEMLACGTPVVAYASGGIPELLGDCGVVVRTGDFSALAAELRLLIDDPSRTMTLSACGPERVRSEFSTGAMVDRMKSIYREAAGR